jgi:hypothetical protein
MHHNSKLLILFVFFFQGCSQSIVVNTVIPDPLVSKIKNYNIAVVYGPDIQSFQFENTGLESSDIALTIDFQDSQMITFSRILNGFFSNLTTLDSSNNEIITGINLYLEIKLETIEYLSPVQSGSEKHAIWFNYKINIFDHTRTLITSWNITGYGEDTIGSLRSTQSLEKAIDSGLRDVGVNISMKIEDDFKKLIE